MTLTPWSPLPHALTPARERGNGLPDPRRDRDPREPEQPPPVEDPESRIPDEPLEDPPAPSPRGEPERRDPPSGEPAWRDPGGGPAQETLTPGPSLR